MRPRLIAISCLVLLAGTCVLSACGDDDDKVSEDSPVTTWVTLPTDPADENFDEPEFPPSAQSCSDLEVGGEFIAFRLSVENVPCDEAARVVESAVEGSPPDDWTCNEVQGTFVQCQNGTALIGFNSNE
jgi:hypothetical protein